MNNKKKKNPQLLTGERIILKKWRADDADRIYKAVIASRDELEKYMPWLGPDYCFDDCRQFSESRDEFWKNGVSYDFVIEDIKTGDFIGVCGINSIEEMNRRANIGYWLKTGRTGNGFCTEASKLLARFGFEKLGLVKLEIITAVHNRKSQRVAEKLGAKKEAVCRNRLVMHDKTEDAIMYSLIPEDMDGF